MRILITGGSGYLGKHLYERLIKNPDNEVFSCGRSFSSYDLYKNNNHYYICDLQDSLYTNVMIKQIQPEMVYHLAANPINKTDESNPSAILRDNIIGTNNLLFSLSKLEKRARLVFASSVTIFGEFSKDRPANAFTRPYPLSLYSLSKLSCEQLIRIYTLNKEVESVCIRMPALVGKYSTHGLFHDLYQKINSDSEVLNLIGNEPGTIKPYMLASEVAEIFDKIGSYHYKELSEQNNVLIGNEDSISVKEVAEIMMHKMNKKKKIVWSNDLWKGDNPVIYLDPEINGIYNSKDSIEKAVEECQLTNWSNN